MYVSFSCSNVFCSFLPLTITLFYFVKTATASTAYVCAVCCGANQHVLQGDEPRSKDGIKSYYVTKLEEYQVWCAAEWCIRGLCVAKSLAAAQHSRR